MGELKKTAEAWLGREIMYAVVTVPADFNDAQRSHVTAAAELRGGFHAAKAVDEEVAAAAAYRLHEKRGDGKAILVFHLGGRTCHATKFRFHNGTARLLVERHDAYLGGKYTASCSRFCARKELNFFWFIILVICMQVMTSLAGLWITS